ncbi:MAG: site-specific DNA-methyltransferase [Candidatus Heimdallarchaeota archaeon]|nr:MAG: site-specific DNA-methyltransferase [Candidatus Heimdallarchaeota archaeon]
MKKNLPINSIKNVDCLKFIPELPDASIDIIITDPPYAISSGNKLAMKNVKKQNGFGGDWNIIDEEWDTFSFEDYCTLIEKMLKESYRVLKSNGTMFLCGTYHNIGIINYFALQTSFNIINEIVWFKRNAFPNLSQKCLTASHENILWLSKSDSWNYNYDVVKQTEYSFDRLKEPNKQLRSVWDIPNNKKKEELAYREVFPDKSYWIRSQKPLRLIDRCLEITAQPGDIIADWFCGSGTTLISAINHSLSFIGCEINPKFVEVIQWRLKEKA